MPEFLGDVKVQNIEDFGAGAMDPLDFGYKMWNFSPVNFPNNGVQFGSNGQIFGLKMKTARPLLISNLHIGVQQAGTSLTSGQNLMALYSGAGALLSTTGDQSSSWGSTGMKTAALGSAQTVPPGFFYVALFTNASTRPSFLRGQGGSFANGILTSNYWFFTDGTNTGRTTSFPSTLGTQVASSLGAAWAAVS